MLREKQQRAEPNHPLARTPLWLRMFSSKRPSRPITSYGQHLTESRWGLECEQSCKQGTAFALWDVSVVTRRHVLGPKTEAFKPSPPFIKFPVTPCVIFPIRPSHPLTVLSAALLHQRQ